MLTYKFQYQKCELEYVPNDVSIQIVSYLTDANGYVFLNSSTLDIDIFTVQTYKSSLPISGYNSFLSIIASKTVGEKYNNAIGGYGITGSAVITQIADASKITPGLYAYGSGIPTDTIVLSIRDKNSIELSNPIETTGSISLNLSSRGWQIDFSQIDHLTNVIDFSAI
jgi:hypothetical protein